jgi:hypothetical protein
MALKKNNGLTKEPCDENMTLLQFKLMHGYEVRPRKDHRDFDLISDALPFGRLWYGEPDAITNAIGHAKFFSRPA